MFKKLTISLFLVFFATASCVQASVYDLVVGGTIKNLAKIYVKTTNLSKLKAKYIQVITNMKEERFQKNYRKFFVVYKQLPTNLQQDYVFNENATKSEVINMIDRVNKRDIMKIINKVPCEFITKQTRQYSSPQAPLPNQPSQVNETFVWKRIIQKI
jgi:hypothetical protein